MKTLTAIELLRHRLGEAMHELRGPLERMSTPALTETVHEAEAFRLVAEYSTRAAGEMVLAMALMILDERKTKQTNERSK